VFTTLSLASLFSPRQRAPAGFRATADDNGCRTWTRPAIVHRVQVPAS
jgi:hypothetical protein